MKFYTNIAQYKGKLLVTGYENGVRFKRKVKYKPYLFTPTDTESNYRTIGGQSVGKVDFDSMSEAREFLKEYKDVDGFDIYGFDKFIYTYIYDTFRQNKKFDYNSGLISKGYIDIETSMLGDKGFPNIKEANNEVTLITLEKNDKYFVYGCQPFSRDMITPEMDLKLDDIDFTYIQCYSEKDLLKKFIDKWQEMELDIISGWNIEFFDIPYLVNRITKILGPEFANMLSPWEVLQERTLEIMGKEQHTYVPLGIAILDYIQVYKKFSFTQQSSYKLDHIAFEELGEKKLTFDGSLADLEANDWVRYVAYNIRDVRLVVRLEERRKLLELVFAMAYDSGVLYSDTFTTVNLWDVTIHNYLLDKNIVVPQFKRGQSGEIMGGFVKEPQVGMHDWVVSFDLTSLYPHLIMMYNISPETFVGMYDGNFTIDDLLNGYFDNPMRRMQLENNNYVIAANGTMYEKDRIGFLPEIMEYIFNSRKVFKKQMLGYEQQEADAKGDAKREFADLVSQYNSLQMAAKIKMNAGYGALANEYFRWYRLHFAEAITSSGQLSIRWIEKKVNQRLNKLFKTDEDYVITCDTDSMYIKADKIAAMSKQKDKASVVAWIDKVCNEVLQQFIDESYEALAKYMNCTSNKMFMKRECIADRAIFVAKKRYVLNVHNQEGVAYSEPKIKIQGIEAVRTSTPQPCRTAIKDALKIVMEKEQSDLHKYIDSFKEEFYTLEFDDVAFPRGVNDIDKWEDPTTVWAKGTPIHVKGALIYNFLLKKLKLEDRYEPIANGSKIKFCYLKSPNPYQAPVISCPDGLPKEFGLDKYIDREMQFDKSFISPFQNVIDPVGWTTEAKASLEDFFG